MKKILNIAHRGFSGLYPEHYEGLEEKIIAMIHDFDMRDKVLLFSFNHNFMKKIKNLDISISTGLLLYKNQNIGLDDIIGYSANTVNPNYHDLLNLSKNNNLKKLNVEIFAYTVDDENHMNELIQLGIDGIVTNFPDILKNKLDMFK